jgi:hypothetical protein
MGKDQSKEELIYPTASGEDKISELDVEVV